MNSQSHSQSYAISDSLRGLIALGRRLFEDSSLSRDSSLSCATCHKPSNAFAEPRTVSHGIGLRARRRNSPSLINIVIGRVNFDWDGRAHALGEQVRNVFSASGDMGIDLGEAVRRIRLDRSYRREFRYVLRRSPDSRGFVDALVAFQESLIVAESRFDRFLLASDSSALSEAELRGWQVFRRKGSGCAGCHSPFTNPRDPRVIVFSDGRFHNLGVGYENGRMSDVGRYAVTQQPSDWGAFRTPTLRNVALTAPYMHDGSLATLEEVVAFYARGGNPNPGIDDVMTKRDFTDQDQADLVAFLKALTTEWLSDSASVRRRLLPTL